MVEIERTTSPKDYKSNHLPVVNNVPLSQWIKKRKHNMVTKVEGKHISTWLIKKLTNCDFFLIHSQKLSCIMDAYCRIGRDQQLKHSPPVKICNMETGSIFMFKIHIIFF